MNKNKTIWYAIFLLMIVFGYMTKEVIRCNEDVMCPRCKCEITPLSLTERFTASCYDAKCDSCGFLFALQKDSIFGIHYWVLNQKELQEDYNNFK